MKNIGLKKGTVEVIPHQQEWHTNFQKEKTLILSLENKHIKKIEHVGSTSIQSMPAKPIIDIVVGIDNYYNTSKLVRGLAKLGYNFRFEPRRYQSLFVKTNGEKETHYLKVLRYKGVWWNEYVHFKDALLKNRNHFEEYKRLKIQLEKKFSENRKEYTKRKSELIKKILKH